MFERDDNYVVSIVWSNGRNDIFEMSREDWTENTLSAMLAEEVGDEGTFSIV